MTDYRVRRCTPTERIFGGWPVRLQWVAVSVAAGGRETVVRAFATRGEADRVVRGWKLLAASQSAKAEAYPPSL